MPSRPLNEMQGKATTRLGRVGFNPRGQYAAGTEYNRLDIIMYAGAGWICLQDGTTGVTPTDGNVWMKFANNGSEDLLEQAQEALEQAQAEAGKAASSASEANTAKEQAETAQTATETARDDAQTAKGQAEAAKTAAETAKTGAETAQTAAEKALADAQTAQTAAEAAQGKAEDAKTAAETAKTDAESARDDAKQAAETAAQDAASKIQDHPPRVSESGTWEVYDVSSGAYTDTGVQAAGVKGDKGDPGENATVNGQQAVTLQGGDNLTVDTAEGTITLDFNSKGTVASDIAQTKKDTAEIITILHRKPDLFGYKRVADDSNPETRIVYTHEAAGMTPARMGASAFGYGDWADVWFVRDNYPCMLRPDGTEAYRLQPNDYSKREDTGAASDVALQTGTLNAMAAIPQIWVKRYMQGNDEHIVFCEKQYDDTFKAYAHTDASGNIKQHSYHAMFEGWKDEAGILRSVSGVAPWSLTGGTEPERTAVKKNGANWDIRSWSMQALLMDMCTMISKHDNSEAAFGHGHTTGGTGAGDLLNTGTLDTKGAFWGDLTGVASAMKVFHIENFWGNRWDRIIGLLQTGGTWLAKMTPEGAGYNLTGAGYETFPKGLGPLAAASGNGGQHATYSCDLGTVPVGVLNGSATTYNGDWCWWNTGILALALAGGYCSNGARCGSRCLTANAVASWSSWAVGASPCLV